jgi:dUTPase
MAEKKIVKAGVETPEEREATAGEFFERMREIRQASIPVLKVALVRDGAIFEKNGEDDAAYDVRVFAREIKPKYIKYMLGIKTEIPKGWVARVWHRSSNSDKDGIIANLVGTIDAGFRGEWQARVKVLKQPDLREVSGKIYFTEVDNTAYPIDVWEDGEKALQVTLEKLPEYRVALVSEEELSDSERGEKGHGASGS